jgi:uncharacterized coiled-coil protein SlyX
MENNYSNYDMLDKMIANNKKAKSWTAFWMVLLCLMALAVLWLANTVSEKNKTISAKNDVITATTLSLEQKSRIIDSLTENCNDAKTNIIKTYDSVITDAQVALDIVNTKNQSGPNTTFTPVQKEELKKINTSIQKVKGNLNVVKAEIKKNNTRLFIQYNDQKNTDPVNKLQSALKEKTDYVMAPPEYINSAFSTVIKFYNYQNADEEKQLKSLLTKYFNIPEKNMVIKYENNPKIKTTVELWIGTRSASIKTLQMKQTN